MRTIFEAVIDAQTNYTPAKIKNKFTGDLEDISAAKVKGICACRGACGSHTGPCSMKAAKEGDIQTTTCKACSMAGKKVSAGGPGSGRRKGIYTHPFETGKVNEKYKSVSKGLMNSGFKKIGFDTSSTSFAHKDGSTAKVSVDKNRNLKLHLNAPEAVHHNMKLMMK